MQNYHNIEMKDVKKPEIPQKDATEHNLQLIS